jgi:GTP-binding protein
VEEALAKAGAEPGCAVRIATREFDWQPTIYAGAEFTPGNRGDDYRLEEAPTRASAADRLAARKARRVRPADEPAAPDASSDIDSDEDFGEW